MRFFPSSAMAAGILLGVFAVASAQERLALAAPSSPRAVVIAGALDGIRAGKRPMVYIDFSGGTIRAKVVDADPYKLVVAAMGASIPLRWNEVSDRRLYHIGRKLMPAKTAAQHLALGLLARAAGLEGEASNHLAEASRLDPALVQQGVAAIQPSRRPSTGDATARFRASSLRTRVGRRAKGSLAEAARTGDPGPAQVILQSGNLRVVVSKSAGGFIHEAYLGSNALAAPQEDIRGSFLDVFIPADPTAPFPAAGRVLRSRTVVTSLRGGGASSHARGHYVVGSWKIPFALRVQVVSSAIVRVEHMIELPAQSPPFLASVGVAIPLALAGSKHRVRFTAGGEHRVESWRLDQSDEKFPQWLLSDSKSRWPIWRVGGVFQDAPNHYAIWKTSRSDTSSLRTDEGAVCGGWLDVTAEAGGVMAVLPNIARRAPAALTARCEGLARGLYAYFHPPYAAPLDLRRSPADDGGATAAERRGYGPGRRVTNSLVLQFHGQIPTKNLGRLAQASGS